MNIHQVFSSLGFLFSYKRTGTSVNNPTPIIVSKVKPPRIKLGIDEIYWKAKVTDYNPPIFEVKKYEQS